MVLSPPNAAGTRTRARDSLVVLAVAPTSLPRSTTFGLLGLVLSTGAPAGLLLLRLATGRASFDALPREWSREWTTYVYLAFSTALAFGSFGAALGHAADRLMRLARVDALTGLQNRSGLAERLAIELRRGQRYGHPLSVLLIDCDRLKAINDRHGHAVGDDALGRIGTAIRDGCRVTDVAGRWGGDEFLVLAPSTPLQDARQLAERIRGAVVDLPGTPPLTVSIGVACAPAGGSPTTPERLLSVADDALYAAKGGGRDRVEAVARLRT